MKFCDRETYKNLSGIYKITQISSGLVYIGQTKMKFKKRYWHHKWKLKNNQHDNQYLQNAWNRHGSEDFIFEVVCVLNRDEDMNKIEINYIKEYDSHNNGFNLTIGGEGKKSCPMSEEAKKIVGRKNRVHNLGKKHSEETKRRMRESSPRRKLTEEQKTILLNSRIGSKHSDEAKEKMRKKKIGSKNIVSKINETQAYQIKVRIMNGEKLVDIYDSTGISYGIIRSILKDKTWNHVQVEGWSEFVTEYNNNITSCLSDEKVRSIRKQLAKGLIAKEVSDSCGVGISVVYGIKQGRTYKHVK